MKILFISRATLYSDGGGDTIQLLNTARNLQQLGVSVDVRLCNETIDYSGYNALHFFNIIRPADILIHIKRSGLPFFVSTIYVDYSEYEKKMRGGLAGMIFKWIPGDWIEYAKVVARRLLNGERIVSPSYLWMGQRRSIRHIIRKSVMLLPNSHSEYKRLEARYSIAHPYRAIPNAIDPSLFPQGSGTNKNPLLVICVGRIEGRKNQLNLIKALSGTPYQLIIIGAAAANQKKYFEACQKAAGNNVSFVQRVPQQELIDYYQRAKVHVLASWFETTGLSSLEAAAMGCNLVITDKGDTREYFGNYAFYCEPDSPATIFAAVEKAALAPINDQLREKIFTNYTWLQAARQTLEAYGAIST